MLAADLKFDAENHRYTVGGERWPSVTEVLEQIEELDGIPRAVLKAAGEFGSHVHLACHLFNQGVLDEPALDPHLAPYLAGWKIFLRESGARVIDSELRVSHPQLKYAGTLDCLADWRGRRVVIDIKTSATIPRTAGPQTAAYAEAFGESRIARYVVHLKPDATYRTKKFTDSTDFSIFKSALNLWRWRAK